MLTIVFVRHLAGKIGLRWFCDGFLATCCVLCYTLFSECFQNGFVRAVLRRVILLKHMARAHVNELAFEWVPLTGIAFM